MLLQRCHSCNSIHESLSEQPELTLEEEKHTIIDIKHIIIPFLTCLKKHSNLCVFPQRMCTILKNTIEFGGIVLHTIA